MLTIKKNLNFYAFLFLVQLSFMSQQINGSYRFAIKNYPVDESVIKKAQAIAQEDSLSLAEFFPNDPSIKGKKIFYNKKNRIVTGFATVQNNEIFVLAADTKLPARDLALMIEMLASECKKRNHETVRMEYSASNIRLHRALRLAGFESTNEIDEDNMQTAIKQLNPK